MNAYRVGMKPDKPRLVPTNDTGLYLFQHEHRWVQIGMHTWPNGQIEPLFRCTVCTDIICNEGKPA